MTWWLPTGVAAAQCVEAYQVRGAGTFAASLVNLNSPGTNDALVGVAPTFDDNKGWITDGLTQYMIAPVVIQNGWSIFIQYANLVANKNLIGCSKSSLPRGAFLIASTLTAMSIVSGSIFGGVDNAPVLTTGNYGFAGKQPYRNGIADPLSDTPGTGTGLAAYIGALNGDGTPKNFSRMETRAIAIYNITLTGAQALELATSMAQLGPIFRGHVNISDQEHQMSSIGDKKIHRAPAGDTLRVNAQVGAGKFHSVSTFDHHGGVS